MFWFKTIKSMKDSIKILHKQRIQQCDWIVELESNMQKLHKGLCQLSDEVGDIYEKELKKTPKGSKKCK